MVERDFTQWLHAELFDRVPSNVAIINRKYHIIDANQNFSAEFGEWNGKFCYEVFRGRKTPCLSCKADLTFADGKGRVSEERRLNRNGKYSYYVVYFEPIKNSAGDILYVIEMSSDITETRLLQREHDIIFDRVPCYVAVIDNDMTISRNNELFRKTFGESIGRKCYDIYQHRSEPCEDCPAMQTFTDGQTHVASKTGLDKTGQPVYYHVTTAPLSREGREPSHVIEMALDITEVKQLEREVLEAERLAAVGETVAGLAHGIKNVLQGLEGGVYVLKTAMETDDKDLTGQGWDMLEENVDRISAYVKDFLNFAKGHAPHVERVDPVQVAKAVYDLYKDVADRSGVKLLFDPQEGIDPANLDHEGIHVCLSNLISNAVDACEMSDNPHCEVRLSVFERNGSLIYEVADDGCGMDYEVKKKVFTTFFSTKGTARGTGLGLLVTRRITQQHGGKVVFESIEGEGSIFRLKFPRNRLPELSQPQPDNGEAADQ
ncbi:MAG: PAS domain-containing protein [Candidatus Abyssobacteria bacterium SURF_5]|uniref:histidine kinase n=1 Tax=Abyssobacteria bacterium (strain SURF_5) TaxID=2093360 RepID=A0A3A4NHF2_ABYX5|nr:MAG: PAS domain-containing protein [Candidatus Abyssubacteria bacterium SURF_5]